MTKHLVSIVCARLIVIFVKCLFITARSYLKACELAGKFYFNTGNLQISLEYFRIAHEKYDQWGSTKKADMLFQFITEKFSGALSSNVSIAASQELQNVSRKRRDL